MVFLLLGYHLLLAFILVLAAVTTKEAVRALVEDGKNSGDGSCVGAGTRGGVDALFIVDPYTYIARRS